MGTNIRAEISAKSPYWLPKHRYYELRHFCMQYPEWKKMHGSLDGLVGGRLLDAPKRDAALTDPTAEKAEKRLYYRERMELVEKAAAEAAEGITAFEKPLLKAVTEGIAYEPLRAAMGVPCCRDAWYALYRRFFSLLDKARK